VIDTYLARRRCLIGESWREPGEPVPEAHLWRLIDALLHAGYVEKVQLSEADFAAAVAKYCPEDAKAIYDRLDLKSLELPNAKHKGPERTPRTVLASTKPAKIKDKPKDEPKDG
jgi:hypothetical protein